MAPPLSSRTSNPEAGHAPSATTHAPHYIPSLRSRPFSIATPLHLQLRPLFSITTPLPLQPRPSGAVSQPFPPPNLRFSGFFLVNLFTKAPPGAARAAAPALCPCPAPGGARPLLGGWSSPAAGGSGGSWPPARGLLQLVEQDVALAGRHLVLADGRDAAAAPSAWLPHRGGRGAGAGLGGFGGHLPGVVVDAPASLVPAERGVVSIVHAARVVAQRVEAVDGAAWGRGRGVGVPIVSPPQCVPPTVCPPGASPAFSLANSRRLSCCRGKSTKTEHFLME